MKISSVGVEFSVDGQTNMTKLVVTFRNFANAPNIYLFTLKQFIITKRCFS